MRNEKDVDILDDFFTGITELLCQRYVNPKRGEHPCCNLCSQMLKNCPRRELFPTPSYCKSPLQLLCEAHERKEKKEYTHNVIIGIRDYCGLKT